MLSIPHSSQNSVSLVKPFPIFYYNIIIHKNQGVFYKFQKKSKFTRVSSFFSVLTFLRAYDIILYYKNRPHFQRTEAGYQLKKIFEKNVTVFAPFI